MRRAGPQALGEQRAAAVGEAFVDQRDVRPGARLEQLERLVRALRATCTDMPASSSVCSSITREALAVVDDQHAHAAERADLGAAPARRRRARRAP